MRMLGVPLFHFDDISTEFDEGADEGILFELSAKFRGDTNGRSGGWLGGGDRGHGGDGACGRRRARGA